MFSINQNSWDKPNSRDTTTQISCILVVERYNPTMFKTRLREPRKSKCNGLIIVPYCSYNFFSFLQDPKNWNRFSQIACKE